MAGRTELPLNAVAAGVPIRVAVAVASPLLRAGLAEGLAAHGGFEPVLAEATFDALREAGFGGADVAVVEPGDEHGHEADVFAAGRDGPRLVLLAAPGDERVGEWLIDGASVLPRGASTAAIAGAVQAAFAGLVATPAAFAAEALRFERVGERRVASPDFDALTPREKQVLQAMSHGLGNREIGGSLGISAHTAKFHVAQIIAKLQAQSRGHAVAKALRAGWVDA